MRKRSGSLLLIACLLAGSPPPRAWANAAAAAKSAASGASGGAASSAGAALPQGVLHVNLGSVGLGVSPAAVSVLPGASVSISPTGGLVSLQPSLALPVPITLEAAHLRPAAGPAVSAAPAAEGAFEKDEERAPRTSMGALHAAGRELAAAKTGFSAVLDKLFAGARHSEKAETAAEVGTPVNLFQDVGLENREAAMTAPSGERFDVRVALTNEESEAAVSGRAELPAQGVLMPLGGEGDFGLWVKDTLIPLDFVVLDVRGMVTKVFQRVAPVPPGSDWRRTRLFAARGAAFLTLPAGRAEALGATFPGARFVPPAASPGAVRRAENPGRLAEAALSGDRVRARDAVEYLAVRGRDDDFFVSVLGEARKRIGGLKREQRGKALTALTDFVLGINEKLDTAGAYVGEFSEFFPGRYISWRYGNKPVLLLLSPILIVQRMLAVFFHEAGHYLAGRLLGAKIGAFRVFLNGAGYVRFGSRSEGWKAVVIDLAGPAAGMAYGIAAGALPLLLASSFLPVALLSGPVVWTLGGLGLFYSIVRVLEELSGGRWDFLNVLYHLGHRKMAAELGWRLEAARTGRIRMTYFEIWASLWMKPGLRVAEKARPFPEGA